MKFYSLLLTNFLTISIWFYTDAVANNNIITVYGVLNGSVFLNVSKKLEAGGQIIWKISDKLIDKWRKPSPSDASMSPKQDSKEKKWQILESGTLQINQLKKDDEKTYNVEMHNVEGHSQIQQQFHLIVLEPVSVPKVSSVCTENNINLTCEVDKTGGPKLTLSLKDNLWENPAISSGKSIISATIQVHKSNSGKSFKCISSNKVSKGSAQMDIDCSSGLDLIFILSIAGGAVLFLIFLCLLIYYLRRRTRQKPIPEEEAELSVMKPVPRTSQRQLPEPPRQLPEPPRQLPEHPRKLPEPARKLPEPARKLPEPPIQHLHPPQPQQEKRHKPRRQAKQLEQCQPPKEKPQSSPHHQGPQQHQEPRPRPRASQKPFDYYIEER